MEKKKEKREYKSISRDYGIHLTFLKTNDFFMILKNFTSNAGEVKVKLIVSLTVYIQVLNTLNQT